MATFTTVIIGKKTKWPKNRISGDLSHELNIPLDKVYTNVLWGIFDLVDKSPEVFLIWAFI